MVSVRVPGGRSRPAGPPGAVTAPSASTVTCHSFGGGAQDPPWWWVHDAPWWWGSLGPIVADRAPPMATLVHKSRLPASKQTAQQTERQESRGPNRRRRDAPQGDP